jgi:RimJ/RimL family protein N-acetyltransferase
MSQYSINLSGVLCESEFLSIGWPAPEEFDLITRLRNRRTVRKWFLHSEVLDLANNRKWLEGLMDRPKEALLAVRLRSDHQFLGTIGWSDWDPIQSTAWFGRIALDVSTLRENAIRFPRQYPGVALDATRTTRDFAFETMKLDRILTYYLVGNLFAARLNERVGMIQCSSRTRIKSDNTPVETIELQMDRQRWLAMKNAEK